MTPTNLTIVFDSMDDRRIDELLHLFAAVELTISQPPRTGLVMLTVQDSLATDFHVGEVLVTEARVVFHGSEGYGMVTGEAPRRALARAAADAVLRCPEATDIRQALQVLLCEEEARRTKLQADQDALVAATRVNFDLMPGA